MYSYSISKNADNKVFNAICKKIESTIAVVKKEKLLIDVDGSEIQKYTVTGGEIKVFNDYEVDAVYVDSDIDIGRING